jgi:hypothetical protein
MVEERVIVLEQRLRSGGVAATIGAITFVFVLVSTIFFESGGSSSIPVWGLVLELIALAVLGSVIFLFTRVVVRVVQSELGRGLEIVYGPGEIVRQVFEPAEVEGAYARHLSFAEMGGWGYRGSLRLIRRAALVTRRGDALELELSHRRHFIVTVDEPDNFVTALKPIS